MAYITIELLRKRCEHNEGEISTLEELSLHQEDLIKIENLQNWCKGLKILLLQSNLIFKIENVNKLKQLEYLNLALNCIEKVENLDRCESLNKLDLTMNFIGDLTSIESLKDNIHLQTLYLTGNPCTDYEDYREFVIGTLPQLDTLDGNEISHYDKLAAKQKLKDIKHKIVVQQNNYLKNQKEKRKYKRTPMKIIEENLSNDKNNEPINTEFWNQPSENTPECRVEMALHSRRAERLKNEPRKSNEYEKKSDPKLFAEDGRPYNINRAKVPYNLDVENERYVLTVQVYKYMDTSELDVDVQPKYVRVTIKSKILQLALDEEVKVDESNAKRLVGSKKLEIIMPKVNPIIKPQKVTSNKLNKDSSTKTQKYLLNDEKKYNTSVEFWNIVKKENNACNCNNEYLTNTYLENSEVPPLE
ncbi:dynein axonemal assembly factor 11 isoform X3 [Daktulosphaira vitifoliae]|uniref:dynein axonemal assembly factor 11 isoform X1 n=1 Tax=Daktulosphaira vitifoliae TaxID=58002 RepID=UPI0021AA2D0D|nr:dynein axonemal assembly factor 11 isoform X1 [Daktulosphaira vitifoliae]XP_050530184.1 dynein axonemal assembly factor 11 isoform X2 [Daktulosphaira vitifoliae]XP_050530185.1 dynein axonemal assembly factor 11 isoform X3 [Daktulosphaira vitifoliae]